MPATDPEADVAKHTGALLLAQKTSRQHAVTPRFGIEVKSTDGLRGDGDVETF